jgi:hypothetical protein
MNTIFAARRFMDLAVGRRVFTACWFSASLGLSILQMRLLAQAWQVSQQALVPAGLMSVWILGMLVGLRLPNAPRAWGAVTSAFALLWLAGPSLVMWHLPLSSAPPFLLSIIPLALVAVFLGASSTAWLAQPRCWPAAGERALLARSLLGLTAGLVVVWTLPQLAVPLALVCCLPLLLLDTCFPRRAPLPLRGSVAAVWMNRYWRGEQPPLQLEQCAIPRGWYWTCLVERSQTSRGYLSLTLLASFVAVMLGSIWGAVPTPFAAGLAMTHSLAKLDWLLAGQLAVVTLGVVLLIFTWRGVIGFPDRLVPSSWQARARLLAGVAPLGMAACLLALGLPLLQAPWWLALSLGGYTLSSAVWGLLLPRLRSTLLTQVQAERHLLLRQGTALPTTLHLAQSSAQEARVTRRLATAEGLLTALFTPLLGWLIDACGTVDPVLVTVGLAFLAFLLVGAAVTALIPKLRRARTSHRAVPGVSRYTAHAASYGLARPAW